MRITILGKSWELSFVRMDRDGLCDAPSIPKKQIRINKRLRGERKLEVIIHECLHAAAWHVDEEYIDKASCDMARILWRLGYRDSDK